MADGTDATVGLLQNGTPDRLIDNSLMTNGSYRQRVDVPTASDLLGDILITLQMLLARTPFHDGTLRPQAPTSSNVVVSGSLTSAGTVSTVSTVTTVASVTAVAGITAIGGLAATFDQINACNGIALMLRDRIVVT